MKSHDYVAESTTRAQPDIGTVSRFTDVVRDNVQRVIVGKRESIDLLLVAVLTRGHVLIEDVPGTGKTTLAKALAASLRCQFRRIQFTPDLIPTDVLGVNVYDANNATFEFRPGPVFTQILLADEINRATPRTQSALLEAMQEGQVSIDGVTSKLPTPFLVTATLNPVEMEGTFPLPEAQLDRFMLQVSLGYPTLEEEAAMLERFQGKGESWCLDSVVTPDDVDEAQRAVDGVRIEDNVRAYTLAIVQATREHERIRLGASPRASLALQASAQATAAMAGRGYVLPDDVKSVASAVLAHRLIVDSSSQLRGTSGAHVIAEILESVPVPIES
jgi:MoxR-like ATPase